MAGAKPSGVPSAEGAATVAAPLIAAGVIKAMASTAAAPWVGLLLIDTDKPAQPANANPTITGQNRAAHNRLPRH